MPELSELISSKRVLFLEETSKEAALERLVASVTEERGSRRYRDCLDAVIDRENILSTGIGMGFAIPHGKVPGEKEFTVSLGISRRGIADFGSLDDEPVHILTCIIGPSGRQNVYLHILARLTRFMKAKGERLLECGCAEEVMDLIGEYEL